MTQFDFGDIEPSTKSGTALAFDLNNWRDAIHSLHSGSSRPSYADPGLLWLDNSVWPWSVKMYTGATDLTIFRIAQNGTLTFPPIYNENLVVRKVDPAIEIQSANGTAYGRFYSSTPGFAAIRVYDSANPANPRDLTLGYANADIRWNGGKVWHEGNDGTGSGLDADLLDGLNANAFAQLSAQNTFSNTQRFVGGIDYMYTNALPYVRGWRSLPDYAAHFNVNLQTDTFRLYDNGNAWFSNAGFVSAFVSNFRSVSEGYLSGLQGAAQRAPAGCVLTGVYTGGIVANTGNTYNGFYYKYLQYFTSGSGWVTIGSA